MKELLNCSALEEQRRGKWKKTLLRHLGMAAVLGLAFWALGGILEAAGLGSSICPLKLFFRGADILKKNLPDLGIWRLLSLPAEGAPLFSYSCPFCGMTRAHLAALRLDFSEALACHPLFFLGLPYLFLLFHDGLFSPRGRRIKNVLCVLLTVLFVVCWLLRLFI